MVVVSSVSMLQDVKLDLCIGSVEVVVQATIADRDLSPESVERKVVIGEHAYPTRGKAGIGRVVLVIMYVLVLAEVLVELGEHCSIYDTGYTNVLPHT